MLYTLKNELLTVKIAARGAEPVSVVGADGTEFLWQADARYWGKTAPWLFPICGRLPGGAYTYGGVTYEMGCHGFARGMEFAPVAVSDTALTMLLQANEETKKQYPFDFSLEIAYRLEGNRLCCALKITNKGESVMPASIGGHPGFCVPVGGVGAYDDCYLEFSAPCTPRAVVFSVNLLDSGERVPYTPEDGVRIPLSHEMFQNDATFLCDVPREVTLRSKKSLHAVTVSYGEAPYLGIWSAANGGDFVCIEPWYGMASAEGVTAFEEKGDMFRLARGESRCVQMDMIFE